MIYICVIIYMTPLDTSLYDNYCGVKKIGNHLNNKITFGGTEKILNCIRKGDIVLKRNMYLISGKHTMLC